MLDQIDISQLVSALGDLAAWLGLLSGVVGTVLAVRSNQRNNQLQRKIVSIEENRDRLLKIESMTAVLSAKSVRAHNAGSQAPINYIEIKNSSPSSAKNISLYLEFFPEEKPEDPYTLPSAQKVSAGKLEFEIPILGGNSEYCVRLPWVAEGNSKDIRRKSNDFFIDVDLKWENASGEVSNYQHRLSSVVPPAGAISQISEWRR